MGIGFRVWVFFCVRVRVKGVPPQSIISLSSTCFPLKKAPQINVSASSNSVGFAKHHRSRSVPELRPMPGQKGTTETQVGVPMSSAVVDRGGFRATIGTSTPITRSSSNPNARRQRRGDMQGQYGKGSFTRRSATPILTPLDRTPSPFKSSASQPSLVLGADGLGVTDLMGRKLKLPKLKLGS